MKISFLKIGPPSGLGGFGAKQLAELFLKIRLPSGLGGLGGRQLEEHVWKSFLKIGLPSGLGGVGAKQLEEHVWNFFLKIGLPSGLGSQLCIFLPLKGEKATPTVKCHLKHASILSSLSFKLKRWYFSMAMFFANLIPSCSDSKNLLGRSLQWAGRGKCRVHRNSHRLCRPT